MLSLESSAVEFGSGSESEFGIVCVFERAMEYLNDLQTCWWSAPFYLWRIEYGVWHRVAAGCDPVPLKECS
jgi:hypothetical protein